MHIVTGLGVIVLVPMRVASCTTGESHSDSIMDLVMSLKRNVMIQLCK